MRNFSKCVFLLVFQTFAIRFGTPEIAQEYKKAFNLYQIENKRFIEGLDSTEGTKEADEIAKAVESLSVGTEKTEESEPVKPTEVVEEAASA